MLHFNVQKANKINANNGIDVNSNDPMFKRNITQQQFQQDENENKEYLKVEYLEMCSMYFIAIEKANSIRSIQQK